MKLHPLRRHKNYLAFVGHRLSGIALAAFLPLHFLLLGSALGGRDGLDRALALADRPLFKLAEWGLVVLLALHLAFGARLLLLEFTRWPNGSGYSGWIIPGALAALLVGAVFLAQLL